MGVKPNFFEDVSRVVKTWHDFPKSNKLHQNTSGASTFVLKKLMDLKKNNLGFSSTYD